MNEPFMSSAPGGNQHIQKRHLFSWVSTLIQIGFIALVPLVSIIYGYQWMTGLVITSANAPANNLCSVKVREIPLDRLPSFKRTGFKVSWDRSDLCWYRLESWQNRRFAQTCVTYFGYQRVKKCRLEWVNEQTCTVYFDDKVIGSFESGAWKPGI